VGGYDLQLHTHCGRSEQAEVVANRNWNINFKEL